MRAGSTVVSMETGEAEESTDATSSRCLDTDSRVDATSTMSMYSAPGGTGIPNESLTAASEGPSMNSAVSSGSPLLLSSATAPAAPSRSP